MKWVKMITGDAFTGGTLIYVRALNTVVEKSDWLMDQYIDGKLTKADFCEEIKKIHEQPDLMLIPTPIESFKCVE